jgi:hypothetical protein
VGPPEPDIRELQFLKNQDGWRDSTVMLRYQNGLFLPANAAGPITGFLAAKN